MWKLLHHRGGVCRVADKDSTAPLCLSGGREPGVRYDLGASRSTVASLQTAHALRLRRGVENKRRV